MHYEFLEESISMRGMTAYRIRATQDTTYADKGELGGFVCKDSKLSPDAWVGGNASAWDSVLDGNVLVENNASVEKSQLTGNCKVLGDAAVFRSSVRGVYAKDEAAIRDCTLELETDTSYGFGLQGTVSLSSCKLTYTGMSNEFIQFRGSAKLVECKIKGKLMTFDGDTYIKYGEIEGKSLHFENIKDAIQLYVKGERVNLEDIVHASDFSIDEVSEVTVKGKMTIGNVIIDGSSIELIGDDLLVRYSEITGSRIMILDGVRMEFTDINGSDVELTGHPEIRGGFGNRINIKDKVCIRDFVLVETGAFERARVFEKETLSGELQLIGK